MKITEEGDALVAETEEVQQAPKMSIAERMSTIKNALSMGAITPSDARELKSRLGLSQAYFTRKQGTPAKRKRKRKLSKLARRASRGSTKSTRGERYSR